LMIFCSLKISFVNKLERVDFPLPFSPTNATLLGNPSFHASKAFPTAFILSDAFT